MSSTDGLTPVERALENTTSEEEMIILWQSAVRSKGKEERPTLKTSTPRAGPVPMRLPVLSWPLRIMLRRRMTVSDLFDPIVSELSMTLTCFIS